MITKRTIQTFLLTALFLLISLPAYCCTPAVPLGMALGGANWIMGSAVGLLVAVSLKCLSFPFFAKNLGWIEAVAFMFIANIITTVLGAFSILFLMTPVFALFLSLPIIIVSVLLIKERISLTDLKPLNRLSSGKFAIILVLLFYASGILFAMSAGQIESDKRSVTAYWILKILYVYGGILMGFIITTFYEEWIIALLSRRKNHSYLTPVIKSNLIALLAVSLIGAIIMLPGRLKSPDFIMHLINLFR